MSFVEFIGLVAGFLSFVSFFPQVWKVVKTKHTQSISTLFLVTMITGTALWSVYGFRIGNYIVLSANASMFVMCLIIAFYKIRNIVSNNEKFF